jgi:hypothetical protein
MTVVVLERFAHAALHVMRGGVGRTKDNRTESEHDEPVDQLQPVHSDRCLADWRGLLTRNVQGGQGVLRALLVGPLRFTPIDDGARRGYAFSGTIALDRLLAGVVTLPTVMASPTRLTLIGGRLRRAG